MISTILALLVANPSPVAMHPNATQALSVSGASGAIQVSSAAGLVSATNDNGNVTLTSSARTGRDVIHIVDAQGETLDVPIWVANDAASIPPTLTMQVTGQPLDATWLGKQIQTAVAHAVSPQPSAGPIAVTLPAIVPPLLNASASFAVPVQVPGNGQYFDSRSTVDVNVQNDADPLFAPAFLMYDDDPETLQTAGVVYRESIDAQTPQRLYYYHAGGPVPMQLAVVLTSSVASTVHVIDASAGPNLDVLSVGHSVTRDFLAYDAANEGSVLSLDAQQPIVLHDVVLGPKAGAAGNIDVEVLDGGPVTVSVVAAPVGTDPLAQLNAPAVAGDGHHRTGLFDLANYGVRSLAYAVGDPDLKITYGDRLLTPPSANAATVGHDYGDYGVTQTFLFSLKNPTLLPSTVYLYERAIGGVVRSTFVVDNVVAQVGCVRDPSQRYLISAFTLAPGASYLMRVDTMTDGSSSYPIEIGLTGTSPQPTAPPISAPDGCFPKPQSSVSVVFKKL